jgi:hypothetical protein
MTEHQLQVFGLVRLCFIFLEIGTRHAHRLGYGSAWFPRNVARFTTMLFGVGTFVDHDWRKINAFCCLLGILLWNIPKDGDPPKRRRRKEEQKEPNLPPNWSGVPEGA